MPKNLNNDYLLWESFKDGDDRAFYDLYDLHSDALYSFGMQFCNDDGFVKDCIHDLFLDLYYYRTKLGDVNSIRFYLLRSLKRKIHKQKLKNEFVNLDKDVAKVKRSSTPSSEDSLINSEIQLETQNTLEQALKELTDQQRRALFLKFEENLTYPEIASILEISIESARTNVYRALKTLRKSMSKSRSSLNILVHLFYKKQPLF